MCAGGEGGALITIGDSEERRADVSKWDVACVASRWKVWRRLQPRRQRSRPCELSTHTPQHQSQTAG